ncbi:MAG: hypothetical protein IH939_18225 [Acidobacteria bacterium]|nr:hypothetical protein [Acidobacteriota bacterium]
MRGLGALIVNRVSSPRFLRLTGLPPIPHVVVGATRGDPMNPTTPLVQRWTEDVGSVEEARQAWQQMKTDLLEAFATLLTGAARGRYVVRIGG